MYNKDGQTMREGEVICIDSKGNFNPFVEDRGIVGKWKGYDIQVVNIQPGDTILFHLNDDVDIETVSAIMNEMEKAFPSNTIIPVNEWILKGMTIVRQANPVANMVDLSIVDKPLEEMYPELFGLGGTSAVPKGGVIW